MDTPHLPQIPPHLPTILLASSDRESLSLMADMIESADFGVVMAETAADCLMLAYRQPPDVVLIDANVASSVADLTSIVARLTRLGTFPVVVMLPFENADLVEVLLEAGAADMVTKPVHWGLLNRRISWMIADSAERQQAIAAAANQRAMVNALRSTATALLDQLDIDTVLDRIMELTLGIVPSESAHVILIDEQGRYGRVVRSYGELSKAELWRELSQYAFEIDYIRNLREMRDTGRPLAIADVRQYEGWAFVPIAHWVRSNVCAPIIVEGRTIGYLALDSASPGRFLPEDAENLAALADQAGIALRNVRLYEQIKRQAVELEERVRVRTLELQREREQLRAILDAMTEGVFYVELRDPRQPVIRFINPALTEITGWTFAECQGLGLEVFHPVEADEASFRQIRAQLLNDLVERGVSLVTGRFRRKNGQEYDAEGIATRINDLNGQMIGSVMVLRDISQQKQLEQQKARFVSHASHELRTPITNLITRLYLIRKQPDKLTHHLQIMEDVTNRMKRLVEDLLDISRFERGAIHIIQREVVLQTLLNETITVQLPEAERKGLHLNYEIDPRPIHLHADPDRLIQVITNLLSNAINYTPTGGSVLVRAHIIPAPPTLRRTGVLTPPGYALIQVEDNGVGIPPEHLQNIFLPFFRVMSEVRGTGLGLSIAREIIERHEGTISVESAIGSGSRFTIMLPLTPEQYARSSPDGLATE